LQFGLKRNEYSYISKQIIIYTNVCPKLLKCIAKYEKYKYDNNAILLNMIGFCHDCEGNKEKALKFYKLSCDQGFAPAQNNLVSRNAAQ
jgi:TPR repeat protein